MQLFFIQDVSIRDSYKINVQVNSTNFYLAFTEAVKINIEEFHKNYYPNAELFLIEQNLSSKFEVSTNNKDLHNVYIDMFNTLTASNNNFLEDINSLYSEDATKMTDYLTKYISTYFLQKELSIQPNEVIQTTKKKLKV
jgi:hypothetical protein